MRGGIDRHVLELVDHLAADRVEAHDALDLVAPEGHPHGRVFVGRPDLERVAAHAELAARELVVVARVVNVDQLAQRLIAIDLRCDLQQHYLVEVFVGRTEAEDAAHAGDDDDVAAQEQR